MQQLGHTRLPCRMMMNRQHDAFSAFSHTAGLIDCTRRTAGGPGTLLLIDHARRQFHDTEADCLSETPVQDDPVRQHSCEKSGGPGSRG